MSSPVLDLQCELLDTNCDILKALRKAHVIASKLKLTEFDAWIRLELNGYNGYTDEQVPEYRQVKGALQAKNIYHGWVTIQFATNEQERMLNSVKMRQSIGKLQQFCDKNSSGTLLCYQSAEQSRAISCAIEASEPMEIALAIEDVEINAIIDRVHSMLLEWTLNLEQEGILGEGLQFTGEETMQAATMPQQINHYYGTVVQGDVSQSQMVSGNHNTVLFDYSKASNLIAQVRESIAKETLSSENKETALDLVDDVDSKISAQKNPILIRAVLTGLRDFLIASGASVTAALIVQMLSNMG